MNTRKCYYKRTCLLTLIVFLGLITFNTAAQSTKNNSCTISKLITQNLKVTNIRGSITAIATVNVKLNCPGTCYFFDTSYLYAFHNSVNKKSESNFNIALREDTSEYKTQILSKTIPEPSHDKRDCVNDLINNKKKDGNYLAFESEDKTQSLILFPRKINDLYDYGLSTMGEYNDGIALVKNLNNYYYTKENDDCLEPLSGGECKQYYDAYDFKKGVALVGENLGSNQIDYYFINTKGRKKDAIIFSASFKSNDFFFLRDKQNGKIKVFDSNYNLVVFDIKEDLKNFNLSQEIYQEYFRHFDTIDARTSTFIGTGILGDSYLFSKKKLITSINPEDFVGFSSEKNIAIIRKKSGCFIYNFKIDILSMDYLNVKPFTLEGLFEVKKANGKSNIIDYTFKNQLIEDYDSISEKNSNIVCSGDKDNYSAQYVYKNNKIIYKENFLKLTQFDNLGYGFWMKPNKEGWLQSGIYTATSFDTLSRVDNCMQYSQSQSSPDIISYFSGFNKNKIGILKSKGAALINTDREYLIKYDCRNQIDISLENSSTNKASIVTVTKAFGYQKAFLVSYGSKISDEYYSITPFFNTNLFQVKNGDFFYPSGLLDNKGKLVAKIIYTKIEAPDSNKFIKTIITPSGSPNDPNILKCGLLDMEGNEILQCKYRSIKHFSERIFAVKVSDVNWNIFRKNDTTRNLPYNDIAFFSDKFLWVKDDKQKCGIVDWQNTIYEDLEYDSITYQQGTYSCQIPGHSFVLKAPQKKGQPFACISGECEFHELLLQKRKIVQ